MYGNDSLSVLSDVEAVRLYPNNYLGTDDIQGVLQTVKEILSNSVDEANSGHGKKIKVSIKDDEITIEDYGRGIPMDYNANEDKYNWEIAFCTLHGGGKFKTDRSSYNSSAGQHGIGAAATQMSSEYCYVESRRDGKLYKMAFKKGEPDGDLKSKGDGPKKTQQTGTKITWKPDLEVFTDISIPLDDIRSLLRQQAIVNGGIEFVLNDEETFYYENGIYDYAQSLSEEPMIKISDDGMGCDTPSRPMYEVHAEVAILFSEKPSNEQLYFHNSIFLEYGGSPKRAMENAMLQFFDKHVGKTKIEDITEFLVFLSSTSTQMPPSFENQTKKAISNKFIQEFLTQKILTALNEWSQVNKLQFERVCSQVKANRDARKAAEDHKKIVKQKLTKNISGMKNRIENYVDCRTKDSSKRELYIAEGLSACGSLKQARDPEYQALLPIRGKIKSVYKTSASNALQSETIKNIVQLVGTGVNTKTTKCNIDDLKFDKIIFGADSDVDGCHIVALLLTLFYTFMPEVIEGGHVYSLRTPLFEITYKDGSKAFAYTEEEKNKLVNNKTKKISRNKGLGEINAEDMAICMKPETQKLIQFTMDDAELAKEYVDMFMGNDSSVRKEYIQEHADEYELDE